MKQNYEFGLHIHAGYMFNCSSASVFSTVFAKRDLLKLNKMKVQIFAQIMRIIVWVSAG